MITVTPKLLNEEDLIERLDVIARRNQVPEGCYEESVAEHMSDFDALKWVSLCDLLRAARDRSGPPVAEYCIPRMLRSMYGLQDASQEELENTDDLTKVAA
jgi:hypothetical protein